MPFMKIIPSPNHRQPVLDKQRNLKMARSADSFVRGSTRQFYEWVISDNAKRLPAGPPIWICGDCHVGNLGPLSNAEGQIEIAVRDLDQTVIGNPAHDLVRLGLSLSTAARGSDLPGVTTAQMLESMIEGYSLGLVRPEKQRKRASAAVDPIKVAMKQAMKRKWRNLAEEKIEDVSPKIPLGECFWPLSKEEKYEIKHIFETEETRKLVTSLKRRDANDKISVADAAYWMKGCSSLGRLRYAVLISVGKKKKGAAGFCLIDIKEAVMAAAPHATHPLMPHNNAERVITGARNLSPYLGERMLAARLRNRPVFLRELLPQDLKVEIDRLACREAVTLANFLARVLGKAHGRQMDDRDRRNWAAEVRHKRPRKIDVPSWLWTSVVDLIAIHEKAYLDHCRRFALNS